MSDRELIIHVDRNEVIEAACSDFATILDLLETIPRLWDPAAFAKYADGTEQIASALEEFARIMKETANT